MNPTGGHRLEKKKKALKERWDTLKNQDTM